MANDKRTGMSLPPKSIYASTTPEPEPADELPAEPEPAENSAPVEQGRAAKPKRRKATAAERTEDMKFYLSGDVRQRLRMTSAMRDGAKLSTIVNEILDRHLPKYDTKRVQ